MNQEQSNNKDNHLRTVSEQDMIDLIKYVDNLPDWALLEMDCKGECQYV